MAEDNHPKTETKKQKAVRTWFEDEDGHLWTDKHIAEQCGVSITLVRIRREINANFASPTKRKYLNKKGETVWKITRANTKGRKKQPRPIPLPEVRGPELNSLLSRLKTDVAMLAKHPDASLIVVCAAEEFLDILNAYPPQDKVLGQRVREVDAWGDSITV